MYQFEHLLLYTPSLTYLKIISNINLTDGKRWEELIQTNLLLLKKFEFFFVFHSFYHVDVELIIQPYFTPFWVNVKQWFVTCEYIKDLEELRLYTEPICKTNYIYQFDSNEIVASTRNNSMRMNCVSTMRLNWTKMMENCVEDWVCGEALLND